MPRYAQLVMGPAGSGKVSKLSYHPIELLFISTLNLRRGFVKACKVKLSGNSPKYQGVKEFYLLARLGCYCKMIVFSPFNR